MNQQVVLWIYYFLHFTYFSIYYSRYSACFHKLTSIDALERTNFYEQRLIDLTRDNTWKKIKQLQRMSYFPTIGLGVLHLLILLISLKWRDFIESYPVVIYILIGALVFIFLANKTQGARVLRGKSPRWPGGRF